MPLRVACPLALCALLSPAVALAESRPTLLGDYRGPRSSAIEVELGWYMDSEDTETLHALAPTLGARVSATGELDFELDWPFGFATVSSDVADGDSEFHSGNPFLAGYYVSRMQSGYLRVGFGFAPPLVDAGGFPAIIIPMLMRGLWDSWMYAPEHLGLVIPFQIESHSDGLLIGADSAAAALIATGDSDDESDFVLQLAGLVGGKHDTLSAGVRLQVVWISTSDDDNAQVAFAPFVQSDFDGGFGYLRFLINLDEPYGVFGDGADIWGIFVGAGARF
jgi:hypothetical protein